MPDLVRRQFLRQMGIAAVLPSFCSAAPDYDLLIAGGRVIDPARKIDQPLDVAITGGKIANVAQNIPRD